MFSRSKPARYFSTIMIMISGILLIGAQYKPWGWLILAGTGLSLLFTDKKFAKFALLIVLSVGILGVTEINTDINIIHILKTGLLLNLAVLIPFFISKYYFKSKIISFPLGDVRSWGKKQYAYIGLAFGLAYLLIPFYLQNTGAYLNWPAGTDSSSLIKLFLGTNGLGIWDELFFVIVCLAIFAKFLPFFFANIAQATLWTAFLYELGFTSWAPLMIFPFALLQGYVFKKTHSLLYILAIHLTVDLVLYLALINAHHPELLNIFIT